VQSQRRHAAPRRAGGPVRQPLRLAHRERRVSARRVALLAALAQRGRADLLGVAGHRRRELRPIFARPTPTKVARIGLLWAEAVGAHSRSLQRWAAWYRTGGLALVRAH